MNKKLIFLITTFALFSSLCLGGVSTQNDAEIFADSIYKKGESLADTVATVRPKYFKWADDQLSMLRKNISFGDWYATIGLPASVANKSKLNQINKIDLDSVYNNEIVWHKIDLKYGQPFNLQVLNTRFRAYAIQFLHTVITAKQDCQLTITLGLNPNHIVYLNNTPILESAWRNKKNKNTPKINYTSVDMDWGTGTILPIVLNLKKGENILNIRLQSHGGGIDKSEKLFTFMPYYSPSLRLAENLKKDFQPQAEGIRYWKNMRSNLVLPALFTATENESFLADCTSNLVETSMFSARQVEDDFNAIKGKSGEDIFIKRISIFEKAFIDRQIDLILGYDIKNVKSALLDMQSTYPNEFDKSLLTKLKSFEPNWENMRKGIAKNDPKAIKDAKIFNEFAKKALLSNPLLKQYPKWVFIKRDLKTRLAGLPTNSWGNSPLTFFPGVDSKTGKIFRKDIPHTYKDQLWGFEIQKTDSKKLILNPKTDNAISDIDISFDGKRILFSSLDDRIQWKLDELDLETMKIKEISPRMDNYVDNYDGVYMPDGKIMYCSSAAFAGVPCEGGKPHVGNLFILDANAGSAKQIEDSIRQITFDQDADWSPTVIENGRVIYTRWEYTDNSHYFSRILMHMNPDGTAQSALYGSTSYWPNSLYFTRQVPNDSNKFVSIVSGHHGHDRMGEIHLFDISKGTKEAEGRVHKYPSYGRKYVAEIKDELVANKWPLFVNPYPLSEKYIVCAGRQTNPNIPFNIYGKYDIYLVDAFDNMVPLIELENAHALEPMPLKENKKPQEIADRTNRDLDYGHIFLNDIYEGEGLKGIPRGTVKSLRIFEYVYAYRNMGSHDHIGTESSWDVKRIWGTVPVESDGSAMFKVPANRPLAIQPLDKDGNALQLMRSWFIVMPGEIQSCVGCHEGQGMTPTSKPSIAGRKQPSEIKEFVAGVRGYSFIRDVQPVLDKYCIGCHDGKNPNRPSFSRDKEPSNYPNSYMQLMRYCRRSGPESNQNMLTPLEFHTSTSELIVLLNKGHKGVVLDEQSKQILQTWIDLNVPSVGTWTEIRKDIPFGDDKNRAEALAKYANRHDDQNAITYDGGVQEYQSPPPAKKHKFENLSVEGFPFDTQKANQMQADTKLPKQLVFDMEDNVSMRLTLIPAGSFVMGSNFNFYDEGPAQIQKVEKPFYMGQFEVSNKQYQAFDKNHSSGYLDRQWKDHVNQGYEALNPDQSVIRVNWHDANKFCDWLSQKTGVKFSLPTEKQWEWAARGGSNTDFWFGKVGTNYGAFENLADWTIRRFAVTGVDPQPIDNPASHMSYTPMDDNVDDGNLVSVASGTYLPNPFGLYDINGNVSEWTADDFTDYLGGKKVDDRKTVRGGSWRDRAKWSRVTIRREYAPWQKIYNVGFRVIVDDAHKAAQLFKEAVELALPQKRNTVPRKDNI